MNDHENSGSMMETHSLILRVQDGDQKALERLFERYLPRVRLVVRSMLDPVLRKKTDAEDLVNTVFIKVLHSIDRYENRSEGGFIYWISGIVANTISDNRDYYFARKRGGWKNDLQGSAAMGMIAGMPAGDLSPSEDATRNERQERLISAMDRLEESKREVLRLYYFLHLSYREIGEVLGCKEDTARKRSKNAEAELRRIYTE